MENFYIQIGKSIAHNEQAMRSIAKVAATNSKSILLLCFAMIGVVVVDMAQDKEIANLKKRINDIEAEAIKNKELTESKEDLDFLK